MLSASVKYSVLLLVILCIHIVTFKAGIGELGPHSKSGLVFTAVKTASMFLLVPDKKSEDKLLKFRHEIDGTLTRIGGPNFSDILVKELHGYLPGDYHKPRPLPPKLLRTAVNARAREGCIYWYMEKPPPKSKCCVTLLTG